MHAKFHPFVQAPHDVSRTHGTYTIYANRKKTGGATVHSALNNGQSSATTKQWKFKFLEKYTINTIFEGTESQNDDELQCFLVQMHYLKSWRSNVVLILKVLRRSLINPLRINEDWYLLIQSISTVLVILLLFK